MDASVAPRFRRQLGTYGAGGGGPTVVLLGGIHGNEPAGVRAIQAVLARLERERPPLSGRVVGLCGNLGALERGVRYVRHDLNRRWNADALARLAAEDPAHDQAERREQRELLACLEPWLGGGGEVLLVDLHSTSSPGVPFTVCGDTLRNRRLALALPVPLLLGLEETIEGALAEHVTERGHAAIVVEGGQHDDPRTQENHEAAIWLILVHCGALPAAAVPELAARARALKDSARGSPGVVEVDFRYALAPDSRFTMRPGFRNVHAIARGTELADDKTGVVRAPRDGVLLMPLYQGLGDDGFFFGHARGGSWLRLSTRLRGGLLDRLLHRLPGIRRHPTRREALRLGPLAARLYPAGLFPLFGYRRVRREGEGCLYVRRRQDAPRDARPEAGES